MTELLLALGVFIALHMVPAMPALRQHLIDKLGRRAYFIIYSALSIIALLWVFHAALTLDFIALWDPAPWHAWAALVLAPLGVFLVLAGLFSINPLSVSVRQPGSQKGAIVAITRHPVLWGFLIWAVGHVIANGDLRSLVLFGSFALFAAGGFFMVERRTRRRLGEAWQAEASGTSILPFSAALSGHTRLAIDAPMVLATIATAILSWWLLSGGHAALFNADPLIAAFI